MYFKNEIAVITENNNFYNLEKEEEEVSSNQEKFLSYTISVEIQKYFQTFVQQCTLHQVIVNFLGIVSITSFLQRYLVRQISLWGRNAYFHVFIETT